MVRNGRLVIDEPTDLPEGTELDLVVSDEGDDLSAEEREALHAALARAWKQVTEGRVVPAAEVLDDLEER